MMLRMKWGTGGGALLLMLVLSLVGESKGGFYPKSPCPPY
jgi:hypothetical protein